MMKKLLPLSVLAIGTLFSAQASAASGATGASTIVLTPIAGVNQCETMSNNVTIQLSKGVVAAWNCAPSSFRAGTCHTTGTNKQQTITCNYSFDATASAWVPSSAVCPAYDPAAGSSVQATFAGRVGFTGSSQGGSVTAVQLGTGVTVCDTTTVLQMIPNAF